MSKKKDKWEDPDGNVWEWNDSKGNHKLTRVRVGMMGRGKGTFPNGKPSGSYKYHLWGVMTPEGFTPADENSIFGANEMATKIRKMRLY